MTLGGRDPKSYSVLHKGSCKTLTTRDNPTNYCLGVDGRYVPDSRERYKWGGGGGDGWHRCKTVSWLDWSKSGAQIYCIAGSPKNNDKLHCCTSTIKDSDADKCGTEWFIDSPECVKYMKSYCSKDSNYIDNNYCRDKFKNDQQLSRTCSQQRYFLTKECQDFCSNEYEKGTNSEYAGVCVDTAKTYCKSHKGDSRCNCLNAVESEDFQELEDALPESIANYMCFWKDCKNTTGWSDQFKPNSTTYQCPECAQKIEIDGSTIQTDIVNIKNSCNINGDDNGDGGDGDDSGDGGNGDDSDDSGDGGPVDVIVNIYKNTNQTLRNILIGLSVLMILLFFI